MKHPKPLLLAIFLALTQIPMAYAQGSDAGSVSNSSTYSGNKPVTIGEVEKTAPPERGTGSLTKELVKHASPNENFQTILRNIPGFTVTTNGPGNLTSNDNTFTYQGFKSDQLAVQFDGVNIDNLFRGGITGQGDDHALTPIGMGQFSGVKVYSGANTAEQTGINALGGTINYIPRKPTDKFYAKLSGGGGEFTSAQGNSAFGTITLNSGTLPYVGAKLLGSYSYEPYNSFIKNVHSINNNYYFAGILPYNHGMSQLSIYTIYNAETGQFPENAPVALIQKYGPGFQWNHDAYYNINHTKSFSTIVGWKSMINNHVLAKAKFFITHNSNDRTAFGNAEYYDKDGYTNFDGYPLPTSPKKYKDLEQKDGRPSNTYNMDAMKASFGNYKNGTQYQRYIDNFGQVGFKPAISFLLPDNVVTLGGEYISSSDHSGEYWYGSPDVPTINGYNNAWNEHDYRSYSDVFLQDRVSLLDRHLIIIPGAKYYMVHTSVTDGEGYDYKYGGTVANTFYFWEPSFGVSYMINKDMNAYVHYGQVYKIPDSSAYYGLMGSGPTPKPFNTKPESVDSIDTGLRYNVGPLKTSAAYFARFFKNKFSYYYSSNTQITYVYNVGSAFYQGVTLSADLRLPKHFNAFANYTLTSAHYTSTFAASSYGHVSKGEAVANVPDYNLNFGLGYHIAGFSARLTDHVVGPQFYNNSDGVNSGSSIRAYNITNLNLGYVWRPDMDALKKVSFNFYVDNLFNEKYFSYMEDRYRPGYLGGSYAVGQPGAPTFVGADLRATF